MISLAPMGKSPDRRKRLSTGKRTTLHVALILLLPLTVSTSLFEPGYSANSLTPSPTYLLPGPLTIPQVLSTRLSTGPVMSSSAVADDFQVTSDPNSLPQNEPSVAVNPLNNSNVVAGANDYRLVASGHDAWAGVYTSFDGGQTWRNNLIPGFPGSNVTNALSAFGVGSDPALAFDAQGNLYYAGIVFNRTPSGGGTDGTVFVSKSTDKGLTFSQTVIVALGHGSNPFNDKPYIAVDGSTGTVYASWTRFTRTTGVIQFSRSTDGGLTWSTPITLSDTGANQGSIPTAAQGRVYVTWLDLVTSTVKLGRSDDGGATFSSPRVVVSVVQLPSPLPNSLFRTNSFPTLSVDPLNRTRLSIAWADYKAGNADILDVSSVDGGVTWTMPVRVNDDTTTNDQFFPWLTVDSGVIHIVFYDRREDPLNHNMDIFYSASTDFGHTFQANQKLTDVPSNPDVNFSGKFIGDYIGLAASSGHVHAVWTDTRNMNQDIFTEARTFQATVHDAAVTGISVSRTFAYAGIPSALPIKINVTVANQGTVTETTMTVRAKANATVIGIQTVTNLTASSTLVVTFSWNTTLVARGNYTLSGNVTLVEDSNLSNNAMSLATPFQARKAGDVDIPPDGAVDITDVIAVYTHQFTISKPSVYDINNDGAVDVTDVILTYLHQFT